MNKLLTLLLLLSISTSGQAWDDWDDEWDDSAIDNMSRSELFNEDLSDRPAFRITEESERQREQKKGYRALSPDNLMATVLIFSLNLDQEHNLSSNQDEMNRISAKGHFDSFNLEEGGGTYESDFYLYFDDEESRNDSIFAKNIHSLNERLKTLNNQCDIENKIVTGKLPESAMNESDRVMPLLAEVFEHVIYGIDGIGITGDRNLVAPKKKSFYYFGYNNSHSKKRYNFCTNNQSIDFIDKIPSSRPSLSHLVKPITDLNNTYCPEFNKLKSCMAKYMSRERRRDNGRSL